MDAVVLWEVCALWQTSFLQGYMSLSCVKHVCNSIDRLSPARNKIPLRANLTNVFMYIREHRLRCLCIEHLKYLT